MKRIKNFFRYDNIGLLFILPAFCYMMFFVGYPIISNIILSTQNVSVRNLVNGQKKFIGLDNYIAIFHDDVFLKAMGNTLTFTVACLIFQFLIGFLLAYLALKISKKEEKMSRHFLIMSAWITPVVILGTLFIKFGILG